MGRRTFGRGVSSAWGAVGVLVLGLLGCASNKATGREALAAERSGLSGRCGTEAECSGWVYPSLYPPDGERHLIYVPDQEGDRIPDFGRVGWKEGALGLPSEQPGGHPPLGPLCGRLCKVAPDTVRTEPDPRICKISAYDGGKRIQAALDAAGAEAAADAANPNRLVQLGRGHYAVHNRLFVPSGVVLAGAGVSPLRTLPPTTLHVCGPDRSAAIVLGAAKPGASPPEPCDGTTCDGTLDGAPTRLLAGFNDPAVGPRKLAVPAGTNFVNVGPTTGLAVGDSVLVTHRQTAGWTRALGMSKKWNLGLVDQPYERTITRIEPRDEDPSTARVFFDQPFTTAFDVSYTTEHTLGADNRWYLPHTIQKFATRPVRGKNVGLYGLRVQAHQRNCARDGLDCNCEGAKDGVRVSWAEDAWILDVALMDFWRYGLLIAEEPNRPRRVTVERVSVPRWDGLVCGARRYGIVVGGDQNLVASSSVNDGRHDFLPAGAAHGPNVFWRTKSTKTYNHWATHHRWSNGALFDGIKVVKARPGGGLGFAELTDDPTSDHGWTGANLVVWNSSAPGFRYFNPPTAQNWLIGSTGRLERPRARQGETSAHFDFYSAAEHERSKPVGLSPSEKGGASLYRTAAYLDRQGPNLEHRTYFVGDADSFAGERASGDPTFASPALLAWVGRKGWPSPHGLDHDASSPRSVPLTFRYALAEKETVVHAYLAFRIRRSNVSPNDAVFLAGADMDGDGFDGDSQTYSVGQLDTPPYTDLLGPSVPPGGSFLPKGAPAVRVLDLYPLIDPRGFAGKPPMNRRLSPTDPRGELHVVFRDFIQADWVALTIVTTRP
jgi:hypothetical protein